jgi:3-methyladenine DNA glycosylase/8-oxoguanine DNA glycosylase
VSAPVRGLIEPKSWSGPLDLYATLECGQTYCWRRSDGQMFSGDPPAADAWYETVVGADDPRVDAPVTLRIRQQPDGLAYEASEEAEELIRSMIGLDDPLEDIYAAMPSHPLITAAIERYPGLRIVADPPVACLLSFICSAQMRVARTYQLQLQIAETFGQSWGWDGVQLRAFPTAERLAQASETELRELGLGYRAPYVVDSAELIATGELHPTDVRGLPYEQARTELTRFIGVGEKVADCVLLFALGYHEAVPLDTWMRKVINSYLPHVDDGSYTDLSAGIRQSFGGDIAGYTQTHVFHLLRQTPKQDLPPGAS